MTKCRILIADDHEVVRHGIRSILTAQPGWEVCGEAVDGRDAVSKAEALTPDIIVMDIGMPKLNGLEATRQILKNRESARILILTMYETEQIVGDVLAAGARGYLLKSDAGRDLVAAIEALQRNRTFFTSGVAETVLAAYLKNPGDSRKEILTPREREVVQLLAEGKSTKEVAVALNLSVKTAETHRSNLMRKLDIHSVSELVLYAVRNNLVQVPDKLPLTTL
jgi:DNA-binding NarL/FixJ family response regulator